MKIEPNTKGSRYNNGKPQLSLVLEADEALRGAARVLEHGMKKYARSNWKRGLDWNGIIDCMLRHTLSFANGEDMDEESKQAHVDHILCNALFLSQMFHTRKDLDDRPKETKE